MAKLRCITSITAAMMLWCLLIVPALSASELWVTSPNAKLKSARSASSPTLAELPVGSRLNRLSYEKRWYKVSTRDGREGWIYRGKVSRDKPETSPDDQDESLGDLMVGLTGSSIEADAADSSRSIRGLSPEAQAYADQTGTPQAYQDALDGVLEIKAEDRELENFLKAGKIGEFAE